jgi:hypothetical protein
MNPNFRNDIGKASALMSKLMNPSQRLPGITPQGIQRMRDEIVRLLNTPKHWKVLEFWTKHPKVNNLSELNNTYRSLTQLFF